MPVSIIDFEPRQSNEGEPFNALILEGEIEVVQSSETGEHYATAQRASIPSTFDEDTAIQQLGKQLPGTIERVPCAEYEYAIPNSDKKVILNHTYKYNPNPEAESMEEHVFESHKNGQETKAKSLV